MLPPKFESQILKVLLTLPTNNLISNNCCKFFSFSQNINQSLHNASHRCPVNLSNKTQWQ